MNNLFNNLLLLNNLVPNHFDWFVDIHIIDLFFFYNNWHFDRLILDLRMNSAFFSHIIVVVIHDLIARNHISCFNNAFNSVRLILNNLIDLRHVLDSVDGVVHVLRLVAHIRHLYNLIVSVGLFHCAGFEAGVFTSYYSFVGALDYFAFEDGLFDDAFDFDFTFTGDLVKLRHLNQPFHLIRHRVLNNLKTRLLNDSLNGVGLRAFADMLMRHLNNVLNAVGSLLLNYLLNGYFDNAVDTVGHMHNVFNGFDCFDQFFYFNEVFDWLLSAANTDLFGAGVAAAGTNGGTRAIRSAVGRIVHLITGVDA